MNNSLELTLSVPHLFWLRNKKLYKNENPSLSQIKAIEEAIEKAIVNGRGFVNNDRLRSFTNIDNETADAMQLDSLTLLTGVINNIHSRQPAQEYDRIIPEYVTRLNFNLAKKDTADHIC